MIISLMERITLDESSSVDRLDVQLIQSLSISPRASYTVLAEVLGSSEQTVARRYRSLVEKGVLRVIGTTTAAGVPASRWTLRLRCNAAATDEVADALAHRQDVSWVTITAGGAEIVCNLQCATLEDRELMLLKRLPRSRSVTGVVPAEWLHEFRKERGADWQAYGEFLSRIQVDRLGALDRIESGGKTAALTPEDEPLLELIAGDGRAGVAQIARAIGTTRGRAARRMDSLFRAGLIDFDIDVAYEMLGFQSAAYLWLEVRPSGLARAGAHLIAQPEVPFVAATTGTANMVVSVICRTPSDLYRFVTERLGSLENVARVEISPVLRTVKQAGTLRRGRRLALG